MPSVRCQYGDDVATWRLVGPIPYLRPKAKHRDTTCVCTVSLHRLFGNANMPSPDQNPCRSRSTRLPHTSFHCWLGVMAARLVAQVRPCETNAHPYRSRSVRMSDHDAANERR